MTERIGPLYPDKPTVYTGSIDPPCNHPEHNPPMFMVYPPGRWRHIYPEGATL